MSLYTFMGKHPEVAPDAFVAPGARLIGEVHLGPEASVWYNCVLRADVASITVGARSNIQDGTVIHVTTRQHETVIGADVLVGHLAMIHGCTLMDRSFVGLGAIVMDGCVVEPDAMLAAGAMLTPGKRVPTGQMWGGRPAVYMRDLRPDEIARHHAGVAGYVELAKAHRASLAG